jgi:cytochrome c
MARNFGKATGRDMFDTMTLTKIVGGFCGSLLVFLLAAWVSETVYHSGGHGEQAQAYVIPVETAAAPEAPAEAGPSFEELFAMADPAAGQGLFRACQSCHSIEEGRNGTGPSLYGVVGRAPGTLPGYSYSAGFDTLAEAWTPEELDRFLAKPSDYAPGTKMTYAGMRNAEDRANLIAYLATLGS